MQEVVINTIEEPPGKGIEITEQALPTDTEARRQALLPYARLIVAAYRPIPVENLEALSEAKAQKAIDGAMEAEHVLIARKNGEIVGLFAYSVVTRENHPALYANIDACAQDIRRSEYPHARDVLSEIDGFLLTNEMVVGYEYRANGVSHALRTKALEHIKGNNIVAIGEILSRSSVEQRLKLLGPTIWAGEVLNPESLPEGLSEEEARLIAYILGRAYVEEFHEDALEGFDRNGIFSSGLFERPARLATEPVKNEIRTALEKIMDRQAEDPSRIYAAMAVTLLQK